VGVPTQPLHSAADLKCVVLHLSVVNLQMRAFFSNDRFGGNDDIDWRRRIDWRAFVRRTADLKCVLYLQASGEDCELINKPFDD
jgi:hypothetical protein